MLSPLLVRPRILRPSKNAFRPKAKEEDGLAACLSLKPSFLFFSEALLGFLVTSSSNESKLSSAFLTVGELGSDMALSKASSIDKFGCRVSWELYFCLLPPLSVGPRLALISQCLFKSVSDLELKKGFMMTNLLKTSYEPKILYKDRQKPICLHLFPA